MLIDFKLATGTREHDCMYVENLTGFPTFARFCDSAVTYGVFSSLSSPLTLSAFKIPINFFIESRGKAFFFSIGVLVVITKCTFQRAGLSPNYDVQILTTLIY